ncbi:MAG: hypothetical protein HWE20_16935 [Gammaproteobacteria bacterium]|nr:hypothetical protein [Gammaproteobacteria bacterium]
MTVFKNKQSYYGSVVLASVLSALLQGLVSSTAYAMCLANDDTIQSCRYEKGDDWCKQTSDKNHFAYEDSCLKRLVLPEAVSTDTTSDLNKLGQYMSYSEARKIIMESGWQGTGVRWQEIDPNSMEGDIYYHNGWRELVSCSGIGLSPCRFEFRNVKRELLVAITNGECQNEQREFVTGKEVCDLSLVRWFVEEGARP